MPLVIGWIYRRWKLDKVSCARCSRRIRHGVTHVNDRADPPSAALCVACYRAVMDTPDPNPN